MMMKIFDDDSVGIGYVTRKFLIQVESSLRGYMLKGVEISALLLFQPSLEPRSQLFIY